MKALIILTLITLSLTSFNTIDKTMKIVNKVNKLRTTWKASPYYRDIRPLLGARRDSSHVLPMKVHTPRNDLPESYDLRDAYPECETLREIRDQSKCGSCWAFGAAETMSDRLCIATKGKLQTRVSAQHLVTCCTSCGSGCFGGWPSATFSFWKRYGIPSGGLYGDKNSCKPYFLPPCDDHMDKCHDYQDTPACENKCQDGYGKTVEEDLTYGSDAYSVSGERQIMQEIYESGSVEGAFDVYEDFGNYKSGIYQHVTGSYLGGHAIKIIGWGVENGVKYWLCANSWNERWGENGYFRILRGENECSIEDQADTGTPKVDSLKIVE
jgi:cathepsin B